MKIFINEHLVVENYLIFDFRNQALFIIIIITLR